MKLKDKIKSYSFWVSLASAIILILKILGNRFGFAVDETMVSDLFTALCSILVLLGIIVPPQNSTISTSTNKLSDKIDCITNNPEQNESIEIADTASTKEQTNNIQEISDVQEQKITKEVSEVQKEKEEFSDVSNIKEQSKREDVNNVQDVNIIPEQSNITQITNNELTTENNLNNQIVEIILDNQVQLNKIKNTAYEIQNEILTKNQNNENLKEDKTDLKTLFFDIKERFSGNLDSYIFELQEEIRKTREGM